MRLCEKIRQSKAIFFDLFHTLFSFISDKTKGRNTSEILSVPEDAWNQLLFDFSDDRLRGKEKDKYSIIRKLAHQYDPKIVEEVIRNAADYREKRFHDGLCHLKTSKIQVIEALKANGKKIGLISNADAIEVSGWSSSPFAPHFDSVVFSYQIGYIKPEPEIYQYALKSLEVSPEDSIFVGDGGSNELFGAKEVGITTVMTTEIIKQLWPEKIRERQEHADYVIDHFDRLISKEG